ncbi:hypothetical protein GCM10014715_57180 [Streptomyces spiralis]|uniref:Uncharacterized protein n=1 Tax=Streptomyces spiralis TaxID=66376 RepID=A0A919A8X9_9ACTN|nr:hypothetical protein GCM10014715_57180 [Streptomyces spiralis]
MPHFDHQDDELAIVDHVSDAVHADAKPVQVLVPRQLLDVDILAVRIVAETAERVEDAQRAAPRPSPPNVGSGAQGVSRRSGRIRERWLVVRAPPTPFRQWGNIARRRRESMRSIGDRRQRREVRHQAPRARHDRRDTT